VRRDGRDFLTKSDSRDDCEDQRRLSGSILDSQLVPEDDDLQIGLGHRALVRPERAEEAAQENIEQGPDHGGDPLCEDEPSSTGCTAPVSSLRPTPRGRPAPAREALSTMRDVAHPSDMRATRRSRRVDPASVEAPLRAGREAGLHVFVINLDRDEGRLSHFAARLQALGVQFERWRATPGSELDPLAFGIRPIEEGIFVRNFREWSRNEAACGVSHLRLLRHIVRERIPWAVVMEDDSILHRRVPPDISSWELPDDAEIVLLNERSVVGDVRAVGRRFSYGPVAGGAGTEGYLISLRGARKLLKILYPFQNPLDFQMFAHFESIQELDRPPFYWTLPRNPDALSLDLKAYRIVPSLISHASIGSSIGNERHPLARYYCKVLLGLDFGDDDSYRAYLSTPTRIRLLQAASEPRLATRRFWKGVDVSHFDERTAFFDVDGSGPRELMDILRDHGVNAVRVSVWVGPETPFNAERLLRIARRAYDRGLALCVVLHYSDTWADPGRQSKPLAWRSLSIDELSAEVFSYTKGLVESLNRQGTPPAIVQTGNEITTGMLWADPGQPLARGGRLLDAGDGLPPALERQWDAFARLLRSAVRGVREAATLSFDPPKVMFHLDEGAAVDRTLWWLDTCSRYTSDFDAIALSFYSAFHEGAVLGRLHDLRRLGSAFPDKDLVLAEIAYPHRPFTDKGTTRGEGELPFTEDGQRRYLERALAIVKGLPTGAGLFWWGATFINDTFEECIDCFRAQALFEPGGRALPALSAFGAGTHSVQSSPQ
jgi:arabinogalactan endo-1,4-beta-galactosidase